MPRDNYLILKRTAEDIEWILATLESFQTDVSLRASRLCQMVKRSVRAKISA